MNAVLFAAGSIGAATLLGTILGGTLLELQQKTYQFILALAAGVMLCAAVQGLLQPALEETGAVWSAVGIGAGAMLLVLMNRAAAQLLRIDEEASRLHGMMFVMAIAIHHFPEGLAAGVSFGAGDAAETISVCAAIALQNIPEAMMIMPAMACFGSKATAFAAAASCGVEMLGLLFGYAAVQTAAQLLPMMLSLAGGAMLYVIFESMLPDAYPSGRKQATVGVLGGYCGMMLLSELIAWIV